MILYSINIEIKLFYSDKLKNMLNWSSVNDVHVFCFNILFASTYLMMKTGCNLPIIYTLLAVYILYIIMSNTINISGNMLN